MLKSNYGKGGFSCSSSSSGDYSGPGDAGGKGALGHDVGVVPAGDPQGISTHRSLILFSIIYIVNIAHWIWLLYFLNLRIAHHQSLLHVRSGESYHVKHFIEHCDLLGIPLWNQSTFLEWVWGFFTSIFRRAISDNGLVTHYTRSILVLISLKCTCILHFTNH